VSHTGMNADGDVARYYDRNTRRFLRFGGGADALAIHRELWGPGVASSTDAKRYVNRLLGDEIESSGVARSAVLDLGCGVGGTLFELAVRFPGARMYGVTISVAQKEIAETVAHRLGVDDRCTFHVGDFHDLQLGLNDGPELGASTVVAVESFAHATDPAAFFRTAARHLSADGRLIVVDDFLALHRTELTAADAALVGRFEDGWRLGTLLTADEARKAARAAGLISIGEVDLTPLIRLGRPRDRVIAAVAPVLDLFGLVRVPFCGNMIGGNALQQGLARGVLAYRMLTFAHGPG
jgi:SAM-dependent methyltransferase